MHGESAIRRLPSKYGYKPKYVAYLAWIIGDRLVAAAFEVNPDGSDLKEKEAIARIDLIKYVQDRLPLQEGAEYIGVCQDNGAFQRSYVITPEKLCRL